jgi:hypothetical protein
MKILVHVSENLAGEFRIGDHQAVSAGRN